MDWFNIHLPALITSILAAAIFNGAVELLKWARANQLLLRRVVLNQTANCVRSARVAPPSTKVVISLIVAASLQLIALSIWKRVGGPDASLPPAIQLFLLVLNAFFSLVIWVHLGTRVFNSVSRGVRRLAAGVR